MTVAGPRSRVARDPFLTTCPPGQDREEWAKAHPELQLPPYRPLGLRAGAGQIREGGWPVYPKTLGRFPRLKLALGWRMRFTGDEVGEHEWVPPRWCPLERDYRPREVPPKVPSPLRRVEAAVADR